MNKKENGNLSKFIDVGNILEKRRLEVNLTIDQVSQKLKISPEVISAIEKGDVAPIMHKIYYQGIVAQYARTIGLKEDKIISYIEHDVANINNVSSKKILAIIHKSYTKINHISLKLFYIIAIVCIIISIANTIFQTQKNTLLKKINLDTLAK